MSRDFDFWGKSWRAQSECILRSPTFRVMVLAASLTKTVMRKMADLVFLGTLVVRVTNDVPLSVCGCEYMGMIILHMNVIMWKLRYCIYFT